MFYKPCQIDERIFEKQPLPKVSIVTPSYNQGKFLEATIQSILAQDYPNIEHIVIDGGSTDCSIEIIKKYADRLTYWVSEPDKGQSHAVNKGFFKATGDIFYWLNSDDLLMPSAVRIAVASLLSNPNIGAVYGDRFVIDTKGNYLTVQEQPSFSKRWMKYNLKIPQETAFFRRELFDKVGGVNEDLRLCMDYDLWIRMSQVAEIHHIPFVLGAYRNHQGAKSIDVSKMRKEIRAVICQNFGKDRTRTIKKSYQLYEKICMFFEKRSSVREKDKIALLRLINSKISIINELSEVH